MNRYRVRWNYLDVKVTKCGLKLHKSLPRADRRGFSLLELLISLSIGLIVLGALYNLFTTQNKQFARQEVAVEMQQNARMAMAVITREIRMAGYNPNTPASILTKCSGVMTPSSISSTCVGMRYATANSITFASDINGNGNLTADSTNPNENIVYDRYESPAGSGIYALGRTSNGDKQPVVEYLDFLGFSYSDASGNPVTDLANIRKIQITIRVIASKPDPAYGTNNGFRTYTLITIVTPRNLAY